MKQLQVVAPGVAVVLDVPVPVPGPDQVLMHVEAVTTCPQWTSTSSIMSQCSPARPFNTLFARPTRT
jgi:hypothetical protein